MTSSDTKAWRRIGGNIRLVAWVAVALCFVASARIVAAQEQDEDARSPKPIHYVRELGPFPIDGRNFTVKLNVICYKDAPHRGMCDQDDEETVKSLKIVDERNRTQFSKSFRVAFMHQLERYGVTAMLLNGSGHGAIELAYEKLPSRANTGVSIQVFGLRDGELKAMNSEPYEFYGRLGDLPPGPEKNSRNLLAGDVLPIYALTNYFYLIVPVHVDWQNFRLDEPDSGEFDVVHRPPYGRKPDVEADGFVHLHSSADKNSDDVGVDVTPKSDVQVLKARFRAAPPEQHDSPKEMWLKVSIDGKVGWIVGLDDYTAIGLRPEQQ